MNVRTIQADKVELDRQGDGSALGWRGDDTSAIGC